MTPRFPSTLDSQGSCLLKAVNLHSEGFGWNVLLRFRDQGRQIRHLNLLDGIHRRRKPNGPGLLRRECRNGWRNARHPLRSKYQPATGNTRNRSPIPWIQE